MTEMAVVFQKAYDWALWIIPKVEKFPKSYRFLIEERQLRLEHGWPPR
jgi:membrane protein YdbS with pleckstrin-like domain